MTQQGRDAHSEGELECVQLSPNQWKAYRFWRLVTDSRSFALSALLYAFIGLSTSGNASAALSFYTGGSLTKALAPYEQSPVGEPFPLESARATGYLLGVADAWSGTEWCPPDGLNDVAVRNVVYKAIKHRPEAHERAAASLVRESLRREWPCATGPR